MDPVSLGLRPPVPTSRPSVADDPTLASTLVRPGLRLPVVLRTPTGLAPLDALLEGGFPRGQLVELVGPRTSGRTRVLLSMLAGVTARGAWAALVDGTDALDPASAAALGISLDRLLWVRCGGRLPAAWPPAA